MRPRQGREDMKVQNIKTNASAHGNEAARKKYYCELNRDNSCESAFLRLSGGRHIAIDLYVEFDNIYFDI